MTTRDSTKTKVATTPQERLAVSFLDAFSSHDLTAMDHLLGKDYVFEGPLAPLGSSIDKRRVQELNGGFLAAFPDLHYEVQQIISQGDAVCVRWLVTGTQKGSLPLPNGSTIAPSNRQIRVPGCAILLIKGDKIVHQYGYWDMSTLLMQIGALPPI